MVIFQYYLQDIPTLQFVALPNSFCNVEWKDITSMD